MNKKQNKINTKQNKINTKNELDIVCNCGLCNFMYDVSSFFTNMLPKHKFFQNSCVSIICYIILFLLFAILSLMGIAVVLISLAIVLISVEITFNLSHLIYHI